MFYKTCKYMRSLVQYWFPHSCPKKPAGQKYLVNSIWMCRDFRSWIVKQVSLGKQEWKQVWLQTMHTWMTISPDNFGKQYPREKQWIKYYKVLLSWVASRDRKSKMLTSHVSCITTNTEKHVVRTQSWSAQQPHESEGLADWFLLLAFLEEFWVVNLQAEEPLLDTLTTATNNHQLTVRSVNYEKLTLLESKIFSLSISSSSAIQSRGLPWS